MNGKVYLDELKKDEIYKLIYKYIDFFYIDICDKGGLRCYDDLSSGEKRLFSQFINLYILIKDNNQNNNILLIDEGESFLHPQWQKEYINLLIKFLKTNFKDKNFHIIFTTHSPFLISDLPKENIIFLDTYKEKDKEVKNGKQKIGNCKVLSHDKVLSKKQTFGANIHTLLSDSFFMEEGLMGEFAKSKIDEIKKFYNLVEKRKHLKCLKPIYLNRKDRFWQIQSVIGEPFLQRVIKNYLEEIELVLLGKSEAIDNEIARLMAIKKSLKNG